MPLNKKYTKAKIHIMIDSTQLKMKVGDVVPFEFLAERHEGEVIELYSCSGMKKALIKSHSDGLKYPITIGKEEGIDPNRPKRISKKSKVLDLYKVCKEEHSDGEIIYMPKELIEEHEFDIKEDLTYFRAVLAELGLRIKRGEERLKIH